MAVTDGADEATALAFAAADGDQAALGRLIGLTQRDVWRYVALHAGPAEADDLTQETYLRALRTLAGFEGRSTIRTWLLVIARRTVIDHFRSVAARPRSITGDSWEQLVDAAQPISDAFTDLVELDLLLAGLSAPRREALVLTQVLGLTYAEVAQIWGCPVGTVRSRVARAREDLVALAAGDSDGGRAATS